MTRLLNDERFLGLAAAVMVLALGLFVVAHYGWDFSALLLAGERQFADTNAPDFDRETTHLFLDEYFHHGAVVYQGSHGYDGAYYYVIARDPLQRGASFAPGFKRNHPHRYQRFLYPALVWVLAGGRASAMPLVMFAINVVCVGLTTWAAGAYAKREGFSPAWLFPAAANAGLVFAAVYNMTFPLCMALIAGAILADRTRGPLWAMPFWALALLVREHALVVVGGFGLYYLLKRDWRGVVWTALAGAPFLAYQLIIRLNSTQAPLGVSKFFLAAPFSGLIDVFRSLAWGASVGHMVSAFSIVLVAVFVLAAAVYALISLRKGVSPLAIGMLACAALVICAYDEWWNTFVNAARVNVPIFFLTGLFAARRKDRFGRLLLVLTAVILLAMIARILTDAAAPYRLILPEGAVR